MRGKRVVARASVYMVTAKVRPSPSPIPTPTPPPLRYSPRRSLGVAAARVWRFLVQGQGQSGTSGPPRAPGIHRVREREREEAEKGVSGEGRWAHVRVRARSSAA